MIRPAACLVLLVGALSACDPTAPMPTQAASRHLTRADQQPAAPAPLVTVTAAGAQRVLWPYLNSDLTSTPEDPVSLIFRGRVDPRALRAALLGLNGDRTAFGFPDQAPFNCTWTDAIGDVQAGYVQGTGWVGSAIQMACGAFGPIRFHLRLFAAGDGWTVAGAHFEVLIPGTTTHQVLSWELAEQLVTADFVRTGLLDPADPVGGTDQITAAPFRTIPAVIYNGLPAELRAAIGGPAADQTADVPILNDGHATVLNVAGAVPAQPGIARQDFTIQFDQVIPKPFCATGPADFVLVQGPVRLRAEFITDASGGFRSEFHANALLQVTPVSSVGAPYTATVAQAQAATLTDGRTEASERLVEQLLPIDVSGHGRLSTILDVVTGGSATAQAGTRCGG
jgi:hypothetical protein